MKRLFDTFSSAGKDLYLVGGAVRDLQRGVLLRDILDLDFTTNASPDETLEILKASGFSTHDIGKRFGTIGTVLRGASRDGFPKDVQITTYRARERYSRGSRHPEVVYGTSIEDDLWRRDFTVNSIAMTSDGTLIDPHGGRRDMEARILRTIEDPQDTLRDDPLRMLRIGRFMSSLGYLPVAQLKEAAESRADTILEISRERWTMEMDKLLLGAHAARALEFLERSRILGMILPEVAAMVGFQESAGVHHKDIWQHTLQVVTHVEPTETMRWAALLHDIGKVWTRRIDGEGTVHFLRHEVHSAMLFDGIAARFRFSRERTQTLRALILNHGRVANYSAGWGDSAVRRLVSSLGENRDALLAFARADLTTADEQRRENALSSVNDLERRILAMERTHALRPKLPKHLGQHLMEHFQLREGPWIGTMVSLLEDATVEGTIPAKPTLEECIDFLDSRPAQQRTWLTHPCDRQ